MIRFFKRIYHLFFILVLFTISICIGLSQVSPIFAAAGINDVINFQGKVVNTDGTNVTDGTYDFVFKLYDGASSGASTLFTESWTAAALFSSTMSSAPGAGDETLTYSSNTNESTLAVGQILWNTTKEESVVITSVDTGTNVLGISPAAQAWAGSDTITNKIYVNDGVFRVNINSLNQDFSGVNFNTDSIFVGLNFNANGEMKPRIQFTSVPYALNALKVAGLTVTNTTGTFTLANSKTLTVNNTLTFSGTDGTTFTFPSGTGTVVTADSTVELTNKTIGSTGLTFSAAGTDITTGTNEHFAIMPNGTGKVGIGTTLPAAKLHVVGDNTKSAVFMSGNVGIGTTNPLFSLEVAGDIKIGDSGSTISRLILGSSGADATGVNGAMIYNTATNKFRCYQNSEWTDCIGGGTTLSFTNGLTSTSNTVTLGGALTGNTTLIDGGFNFNVAGGAGKVGIGTSSPAVKLHVAGDNTNSAVFMSGNVGIGTTLPAAALDVVGDEQISGGLSVGFSGDGQNDRLYVGDAAFYLDLGNAIANSALIGFDSTDYLEFSRTDNRYSFFVGGAEKSRIDGSALYANVIRDLSGGNISLQDDAGNVGIGTTLPAVKLHVAGDNTYSAVFTSGNVGIGTTAPSSLFAVGSTSQFQVNSTGAIAAATGITSSGTYNLSSLGSGLVKSTSGVLSAGAAGTDYQVPLSFTNGLTNSSNTISLGGALTGNTTLIDGGFDFNIAGGAGKVGIGTSSPAVKLHVVGDNTKSAVFMSGNVGIGTTNPTTALFVSGDHTISSTIPKLIFNETDQYDWSYTVSGDQWIVSRDGLGDRMVVTNAGNLIVKGNITNNEDTEVYMGAAAASSNLNLMASNSTLVYLTTNGNVGIGRTFTTPVAPLHVVGDGTRSALFMSGNVGIGTTNPLYSLEVAGDIKIGDSGATISRLILGSSGADGTGANGAMIYNTATNKFRCYQNSEWTDCIGSGGPGTAYSFTNGLTSTSNTVTLGGALTGNTTLIDGGFNFNVAGGAGKVGIGTSSPGVKLHVVGNGTYAAALMSGNVGIGTTAPGSLLELVDAGTTTNSFNLTANSLTQGTALNLNVNSLTSGKGLYIGSTSTALTTGNLLNLNWSPTASTTATGDLVVIGIGSSGNLGNIFNITDSGSSVFSVSETQITSALPHTFTAAGDVSVAYDMLFTNQTASYIKSDGPLNIESGEISENNNLTLSTYGTGNIVMNLNGTGSAVKISGADTTLLFDTVTATDTDFWMGVVDDAGGNDNDRFMIGRGLTNNVNPYITFNGSGNVGIGTTLPVYNLEVFGSAGIGTSNGAKTIDIGTGTGADTINIGTGATTADVISIGTGNSNSRVVFFSNTAVPNTSAWTSGFRAQGAITTTATSGRIWIKAGSTNYTFRSATANAADYSEFMLQEKPGEAEPGDLVMISTHGNGKVKPADLPYTSLIVGAVTTSDRGTSYNDLDYDTFSGTGSRKDDPAWTNVGMMGQVYVKVSMDNGPIKAGDPITTSTKKGIGMKATKSGRVAGFALQPWTGTEPRDARAPQQKLEDGIGMILVLIQPTWLDNDKQLNLNDIAINGMIAYPNANISEISEKTLLENQHSTFKLSDSLGQAVGSSAAFADAVVANIRAGFISALHIETESFNSDTAEIASANIKNLSVEGLTVQNGGIENIRFDGEGNAFFKGTIVADRIEANYISGLDELEDKVASLEGMLFAKEETAVEKAATPEAEIEAANPDYSASASALLDELSRLTLESEPVIATDIATLSGLHVEQDATVSGHLSIHGSSLIQGILNVIETITTNNFLVSGWARFTGSTIFHGDTYFSANPTFNKDTAGIAVVEKDSDSVSIIFKNEFVEHPVITANLAIAADEDSALEQSVFNGELRYVITKKSKKGFTIKLNKKAPADLEFSWIALTSKDLSSALDGIEVSGVTPTPLPIDNKEPPDFSSSSAVRTVTKKEE